MTKSQKKSNNDSSLKLSNSLHSNKTELIKVIHNALSTLKIEYFFVGAFARDILMHNVFNKPIKRATLDTDIAIMVSDWEQYGQITQFLINLDLENPFKATQNIEHRLSSKKYGAIDIIPFGDILDDESQLRWPPDYSTKMNMLGFTDAFQHAAIIEIENNLKIKVASLPGLALLKLFCWADRGDSSQKDLRDFLFIVQNYLDAGNIERLHSEHNDLVTDADDFDYTNTGARLLGRDVCMLLQTKKKQSDLYSLIKNNMLTDKQISNVSKLLSNQIISEEDRKKAYSLIKYFLQGVEDIFNQNHHE